MSGTDMYQLTDTTDPGSHFIDKGWITSPSSQRLVNNRNKSPFLKGEQDKYHVSSECDTHPSE